MNAFWRLTRLPFQELPFDDPRAFERCRLLVRALHVLVFFVLFQHVWEAGGTPRPLDPRAPGALWPTAWFAWFDPEAVALWLPVVTWLAALGVVLVPGSTLLRLAVFGGLLSLEAARYSLQEKIDHGSHTLLAALFVLLFLPRVDAASETPAPDERVRRDAYCRVFFGAQALVLLTYTLAGLCKVLGAGIALRRGEVSAFHPDAMALHIAKNWERSQDLPLGPLLATSVPFGQAAFLGALYLELFALWAAFRPRLHAPWGAALVLFHVGVLLGMGIIFSRASAVLLLLLVLSPFAPRRADAEATVAALPWLGTALFALVARLGALLSARRAGRELLVFCDRSRPGLAERLDRALPPDARLAGLESEALAALEARHPGLRRPGDALLVVHRRGEATTLLRGTAAGLWLRAQRGAAALWAVPLLLVPRPLLVAGARLTRPLVAR